MTATSKSVGISGCRAALAGLASVPASPSAAVGPRPWPRPPAREGLPPCFPPLSESPAQAGAEATAEPEAEASPTEAVEALASPCLPEPVAEAPAPRPLPRELKAALKKAPAGEFLAGIHFPREPLLPSVLDGPSSLCLRSSELFVQAELALRPRFLSLQPGSPKAVCKAASKAWASPSGFASAKALHASATVRRAPCADFPCPNRCALCK